MFLHLDHSENGKDRVEKDDRTGIWGDFCFGLTTHYRIHYVHVLITLNNGHLCLLFIYINKRKNPGWYSEDLGVRISACFMIISVSNVDFPHNVLVNQQADT